MSELLITSADNSVLRMAGIDPEALVALLADAVEVTKSGMSSVQSETTQILVLRSGKTSVVKMDIRFLRGITVLRHFLVRYHVGDEANKLALEEFLNASLLRDIASVPLIILAQLIHPPDSNFVVYVHLDDIVENSETLSRLAARTSVSEAQAHHSLTAALHTFMLRLTKVYNRLSATKPIGNHQQNDDLLPAMVLNTSDRRVNVNHSQMTITIHDTHQGLQLPEDCKSITLSDFDPAVATANWYVTSVIYEGQVHYTTNPILQLRLNLNGHSNKDPQRNPVFFNEKSSRVLEKKMRSLATRGLKGVRGLGVAELWIRSVG